MSTQKWVRSSLRTLSERLKEAGHALSPPTVSRLLRKMDYSLHVNSKQLETRSNHPDREAQFAHIDEQIANFTAAGQPIISVDSKKKELIGEFKQPGRTWCLRPVAVNIHDFLGDSLGRAAPYGIYDVLNNRGTVYVGQSADTPAFAVDVIADWWQRTGRTAFPAARQVLILADAVVATAVERDSGRSGSRRSCVIDWDSRSPFATTPLGAANGTRSNIVCSASSAATVPARRYVPGSCSWRLFAAPRPGQA